jgi:hypothetical protein
MLTPQQSPTAPPVVAECDLRIELTKSLNAISWFDRSGMEHHLAGLATIGGAIDDDLGF